MATVAKPAAPGGAEIKMDIPSPRLARDFRWRVLGDPPPPPRPTRYQRIYHFLYEFNRY